MKKFLFVVVLALLFNGIHRIMFAQSEFSFDDEDAQVCVEDPIQITNNTTGGNTTQWNLCYSSLTNVPSAAKLNTSTLKGPAFNKVVYNGTNYFLFITNNQGRSVTRLTLGDDPGNSPTNEIELQSDSLPKKVQGIDIRYDQGQWYGFAVGGQNSSRLTRIDFGPNLNNSSPTFTNLGFDSVLAYPQDIELVYKDSLWYAFTVNSQENNLIRFAFDSTLSNTPVADTIKNVPLSQPVGLDFAQDSSAYRIFVTNFNPPAIVRVDLASITAQTPLSVKDFSDPELQSPYDISIAKDCRNYVGFTVNRQERNIVHINFNAGLGAAPSAFENIGSLGVLYHSQGLSRIVTTAQGDRYLFVTNVDGDAVNRLSFNSCENSYRVSDDSQLTISNQTNPPTYYYNAPGTYNVQLITDRGHVTETRACKTIEVYGGSLNLGPDTTICKLDTISLSVDPNLSNISWQDNSSNAVYPVSGSGKYYVSAQRMGCEVSDTINISTFEDDLYLGPDTILVLGTTITLDAGEYQSYNWNTAATTRTIEINKEGLYFVNVIDEHDCMLRDTIQINLRTKGVPNVFTPNGDGINDTWRLDFKHTFPDARVEIYNRYGRLLKTFIVSEENWDGTVNGELLPPNTYWYIIYYNDVLQPKKGYITIKY